MEVNLIFRVPQWEGASSLQHTIPLQAEPAGRGGSAEEWLYASQYTVLVMV